MAAMCSALVVWRNRIGQDRTKGEAVTYVEVGARDLKMG